MKYMLLILSNSDAWQAVSEEEGGAIHNEYFSFTKEIVDSKEMVSGDPLQGIDTLTSVTVSDGKVVTTDGPFTETKEVLGGYYVVDVPDKARAVEIASRIPGAARGLDRIEVWPIMELGAEMQL
jgi:hypothetical protein